MGSIDSRLFMAEHGQYPLCWVLHCHGLACSAKASIWGSSLFSMPAHTGGDPLVWSGTF